MNQKVSILQVLWLDYRSTIDYIITDETFRLLNKSEAVWLKFNKTLKIYSGGAPTPPDD